MKNHQQNPLPQRDTIAVVYDFDGTLCPRPMQEYTVLPKIGLEAHEFWAEVGRDVQLNHGESMLSYMRLLLEKANARKVHISRQDFVAMGKQIDYYPGVENWFPRLNKHVAKLSHSKIKVQHYIISAGMKEILEGITIVQYFKQIYASEYHFNHQGIATFPKILITDTTKTQFLFRVNKGLEDLNQSINEHMPEYLRPIPFKNMIYIGDGMTDVPSMALTKKNGGHTIAVYPNQEKNDQSVCRNLMLAGRVDFIAPADYQPEGPLWQRTASLLEAVVSRMVYEQHLDACYLEHQVPPYGME